STIAVRLSQALDDWARRLPPNGPKEVRERMIAIARITDPDPLRNRLRAARNLEELQALAREVDPGVLDGETLTYLADGLKVEGDRAASAELLRRSAFCHPGDFWIHYWLTQELLENAGKKPPGGGPYIDLTPWPEAPPPDRDPLPHALAAVALRP